VRDGLKVIVFEQSPEVLQKRLGFRVNEYGLRQIFARIPDHPALAGITAEQLHDWRGDATTLPPRMAFESKPRYGPMVNWNGIELPHIWRCGNRGDVASALIEKPARGDFRPILDGGYSLQYSPLMEFRQGKGLIVFSQLDAIGRTETEPAAMSLICNILRYVDGWKPEPSRNAVYLGDAAGRAHLASSGVKLNPYDGGDLKPSEQVLILAPGESEKLVAAAPAIARFISGGGHVLALGLDQDEITASLPTKVILKKSEHIAASFAPPRVRSIFVGIGPADVYNRGPRQIPLVTNAATVLGDGVLASDATGNIVFDQLIPWQFDYRKEYNLKRMYRRSSFTLTRALGNLGVAMETPMLEWFHTPPKGGGDDHRWLNGLYLDAPEEWDDPYRFFRW
jgi:beta-galactosidase